MSIRIESISFDAHDPEALARWWGEALRWEVTVEAPDEVAVSPPSGSHDSPLLFVKVPEGKTVKNRVHLDLRPDDQDAEVAHFESLGARRIEIGQSDDPATSWVVLADPEGNEFCILRARPAPQPG